MNLWDIVTRRFRNTLACHTSTTRNRRVRRPERFRPCVHPLEDRTVPTADMFVDATLLTGALVSDTGSNVNATVEMGEPDQSSGGAVNSVWWQWTAPADGMVEVNTVGSSLDTVLAVYTGSAVDALTLVGANDDFYDMQSRVVFQAVEGANYRISVDGFLDATGPITLNLAMSPVNDNFANATPVTAASMQGSTIASTAEPGEPAGAATSGNINSVWYVWTADTTNTVEFNTFGSNFDTLLGVYTGLSVDALTLIAANDDAQGGLQSQVVFDPTPGTTYYIAIDGLEKETGSVVLNHLVRSGQVNSPPTIASGQTFSVIENSFGGTIVGTVVADEPDIGQTLRYDIIGGNIGEAFFIDPETGVIVVSDGRPLDYEVNPTFQLEVRVTDNGIPQLSNSAIVTINLLNSEDAPIFDETGPFMVGENSTAGTVVGTVSAHDVDPGQIVTFAIRSGNTDGAFAIDEATGVVTVANSLALDFEANPVFTLEVIATDNGSPRLSSSAHVTIFVENGNEPPVITDQSFTIDENSPIGTVAAVVLATDPDAGQTLTYSIVSGNDAGAFSIDARTGWITVVDRGPLDFEQTETFSLTVRVEDSGSPIMSCSGVVTIDLNDINESAVFTSPGSFTIEENTAFGTLVGTVSAIDQDRGQTLRYFIVGSGNVDNAFAIDEMTGVITVTGALDFELRPSYSLTILATDSGNPALNVATTIVISLLNTNDAPVMDAAGSMSLTTINQGNFNNSGTLVSTILASTGSVRVTDQDVGAVRGIAVIAADTTNGAWQYSVNCGATWHALGWVSEQSARLLAADALVRFVPSFGFHGTVVEGITFRAWDQTSGMNGCMADTTVHGGTTAFSIAIESASITVRSPIEMVVLLTIDVRDMANAGLLSSSDANQLLTKLNHAKKQLEFGNFTPAENQLTFFKNAVLDLINSGALAPSAGEELMTKADEVIAAIHS
jgi:hypothetical protein